MKARFAAVSLSVLMSILLFALPAFAAVDMTQFGFSKVVAKQTIKVGEAKTISHSGIKVDIPAGAFTNDVSFEILEAETAMLQPKVAAGKTVIMNFAFRVTDLTTNQLVESFKKPVLFSFTDKDVNQWSVYNNVRLDGTVVPNAVPAVIVGRTLTHGVAGATVGWLITSPTWSVQDDD